MTSNTQYVINFLYNVYSNIFHSNKYLTTYARDRSRITYMSSRKVFVIIG
jgi:hypothetical protein